MNEEEIIKYLRETDIYNLGHEDKFEEIIEYEKVLQDLLDLYNKQKEEIEELELENINLKEEIIIEKNKIPTQDNFYDYYNYVSKDKVRIKIKELEDKKEQYSEHPLIYYILKILKNQLEELLNE